MNATATPAAEVTLDCGWGRVVFGQTFADHERIAETLAAEEPGRRDICLYAEDAHVLTSRHPHELFIDPSYTFRLPLDGARDLPPPPPGLTVRELRPETPDDAEAVNHVYARCGMVTADVETICANQRTSTFHYLLAVDQTSGAVLGTVTGIDHREAFADPDQGSSLWCLAVDPQAPLPGVGEALVLALAATFAAAGRAHLDLSVIHDNEPAIALYDKLGFEPVPVLCVKRKNPINEPLFVRTVDEVEALNPYARIVADEAMRRGINVQVLDAEGGYLRLAHGGRTVVTRESLSELTTAVAMSRCEDKRVTRRLMVSAGVRVPDGRLASGDDADLAFLRRCGRLVAKPARGEQGNGVTVGIDTPEALAAAIEHARRFDHDVLLEEYVAGDDLRLVVIDDEVVAAAVRRPATVLGNGTASIGELIEAQSRRRGAATGGEATIPVDGDTLGAIAAAGHDLDDVLPTGAELQVRRTANLHTGGTIDDVTDRVHPALVDVAIRAAQAIDIPVTGIDLIVPDVEGPDHVFIEANERPGLANHEPQPTAARFVDLLFPATSPLPQGWEPGVDASARLHATDS